MDLTKKYYIVAGHTFSVSAKESDFALMTNYEPFVCEGDKAVFTLSVGDGLPVAFTEDMRQEEEGQEIVCGKTAKGEPVFEFNWWQKTMGNTNRPAGWLVCSTDYREGRLVVVDGPQRKLAIDNALMVLYALATADKATVLFHAAAVSHEGRGYMFLGKSGTGKSTHAGLWVRHIKGTELVNDDNPVVRDGVVYGSPWSGKTPCYRNVSYPLGGIVLLSQAPYNKIEPLKGLKAYVTLVSSISGMRWDTRIADGLHETENKLASTVPIWQLECLPDKGAAELCQLKMKNCDY
jgi:hypothetical protein